MQKKAHPEPAAGSELFRIPADRLRSKTGPEINGGDGEHEAITMTAMVPFRNPSHLADLVHEKYPSFHRRPGSIAA